MYTVEMTTKCTMAEKKKEALMQAVKETDAGAECVISGQSFRISGTGTGLEHLSGILGIVMGCNPSSEVLKLQMSYDQQ